MISKRIERLAATFWEEAGAEEPFPRNLELPIHYAKPSVAVVPMEQLRPDAICVWLAAHGHDVRVVTKDRWVDGCLYATKGVVFLFFEARLTADHRRVVIGHEFGHYLADYEDPRRRTVRRLDRSLLSVFDGERLATEQEILSATLADVSAEPHVHFMDRSEDGTFEEPISHVERTANALALELLAPWRVVVRVMQSSSRGLGAVADWQECLERHFGLPHSWAGYYAQELWRLTRARRSFSEALGM